MHKPMRIVTSSPWATLSGAMVGVLMIIFVAPVVGLVDDAHDWIRPVAIEWRVTEASVVGGDVVLYGTMIKQRECLFVPPTVARDDAGQNYAVESGSPTAGRTWGPSDVAQRWGPWTVRGAAGKRLEFVNVYVCGTGRPSIVKLGAYVPPVVVR